MPVEPDDFSRIVAAHRAWGDAHLAATMALAQQEGVGPESVVRSLRIRIGPDDRLVAKRCLALGVTVITRLDAAYPQNLAALLGASAPPVLYVRGDLAVSNATGVGIIGMRRPTAAGLESARHYARAVVSHGFAVVSGNARGVDAAAHGEALRSGGSTVVFPPTPPEQYVPAFEVPDGSQIVVLTPFAPGSTIQPYFFLRRNELVAALACATIVVETGARGGTLNTVSHLRRLGRPWFVNRLPPEHEHHRAHESLIASGGIPCSPKATGRLMRSVMHMASTAPIGPADSSPDLFPGEARP